MRSWRKHYHHPPTPTWLWSSTSHSSCSQVLQKKEKRRTSPDWGLRITPKSSRSLSVVCFHALQMPSCKKGVQHLVFPFSGYFWEYSSQLPKPVLPCICINSEEKGETQAMILAPAQPSFKSPRFTSKPSDQLILICVGFPSYQKP